jgi:hypothetical protein
MVILFLSPFALIELATGLSIYKGAVKPPQSLFPYPVQLGVLYA